MKRIGITAVFLSAVLMCSCTSTEPGNETQTKATVSGADFTDETTSGGEKTARTELSDKTESADTTPDSSAEQTTADNVKVEVTHAEGWSSPTKGISLAIGETDSIVVSRNKVQTDVEWASLNPLVATISNSGIVTGVSKGKTTISALYNSEIVYTVGVYVERSAPEPLYEIQQPTYELASDGIYYETDKSGGHEDEAKLMLCGDMMCIQDQIKAAMKETSYDFRGSFVYIKKVLDKADFAIGGLETMLSETSPYKNEQVRRFDHPNCNAPATFLDAVRYAGFDAVVTANNHNMDTGIPGILKTLLHLDEYNLPNTGVFSSADDTRYLIFDINGIKVGFLSYGISYNTFDKLITAQEKETYLNGYSKEKAQPDMKAIRAAGAEFVITYLHVLGQNATEPKEKSTCYLRELAEMGADYIVGSHCHVLQKYGHITTSGGRSVPVCYCMGNFVTSMNDVDNNLNRDGFVLYLELQKSGGKVRIEKEGAIPFFIMDEYDDAKYVVMPISTKLNGGITQQSLTQSHERIIDAIGTQIKEITDL